MTSTTITNPDSALAVRLYDRLARIIARGGWLSRYGSAILGAASVTLILARSHLGLDQANISLTYLLTTFCIASVAGLGPGIVASILSFILYNYTFVPPYYVLTVDKPQDLLRLIVFLIAALLASCMAALAFERAQLLRQIAEQEVKVTTDRFKATLLASISHDLRTPLVTIMGVATALRHDNLPRSGEEADELLDTLIGETTRLNRLVGNLLEMSRIESGVLETNRDWEMIDDIIGGVLSRFRPQFDERPIQIVIPADLAPIWVNAALIDQVLTNLLENALKYTPATTPITLTATQQEQEIWVQVHDSGPGIPPEDLPKLFDTFFRSNAPARGKQGTGLGLAICKGIIEAHGGRIWAESYANKATVFTFTLPLLSTPTYP